MGLPTQALDTLAIPEGSTAHYIGFEVMTSTKVISQNKFELLVYPNPVDDWSWIQFKLKENTWLDLLVIDVSGKVFYRMEGLQPAGIHKIPLSFLSLEAGHYQVILRSKDYVASTALQKG